MRLRPRLLVQAYRARPRCEVVVSRPLLRSPAQESRARRMEANSCPRGARGVETATARGMSPSAKASARAGGRGALLPGVGGRASSAERPDRRQVVLPATLECGFLARTDRLRRFDVESCRGRRRSALVGHAGHFDRAFHRTDRHLERVSDADLFRGLHADPLTWTRPPSTASRGATRLEETRCPQPLIDPRLFHGSAAKIRHGPQPCSNACPCGPVSRGGRGRRRSVDRPCPRADRRRG